MISLIFLADFSPIKPDFGLILWTIIIFCLFWGLIGWKAFGPIARALKAREADIQGALDEAKKAREEMASLRAENEELLQKAREERASMLKEAKDTKNKIISEAKEKAKSEANKIIHDAKIEIDNEKKSALAEVKDQVGLMALEIAEKVIRKELSGDKAQEDFVNDLVKEINRN